MFFNIDDLKIKNEIAKYKMGDGSKFAIIVEYITPYIYNYPRAVFHVSDDACSDFYEYILLNFESILKSYTISKVKFTTWLTIVLRNRYLNFIRKKSNLNNVKRGLSFDRILDNGISTNINLYMIIPDKKDYSINSDKKVLGNIIDKITSLLNDKYRVLFHLYYIDFLREEDIRFLSIFFKRSIKEIIEEIDKIKNSVVSKYEKREIIMDKLAKNYQSILSYQEIGDKNSENNAKKYQEILLNEYRTIKCFPAYESIASFCGFPIGTVSAGIARIKYKIKTIEKELHKIMNDRTK